MDPITQKIISLTITPDGESVSNVFQTYAWGRPDVASNGAAGIHTSLSTVDLTKGGMVMGKRWDTGSDWYVADTVISPLDGSQGTPGSGNKEWKSHPSATNGAEQDWTVPAGVTSVCIICVGGGAGADGGNSGGGGGLTWINDVPVTPGTILKVKQGKTGGRNGSGNPSGSDTDGQESYVKDASGNLIIQADGGRKNASDGGPGEGGTSSKVGSNYQSLTYGGGNGGAANQGNSGKGGGGGAGGYSGDGGNGGQSCSYGGPGSGGGAGGGGGHCSQDGGQGGGVDIYGQGSDGAGGADGNYASPGQGGSGGGAGAGTYGQWTEEKGKYGGGSGAGSGGAGRGAVRILWGAGRAFPSTNVQQDVSYTHAEYGSCNNNDKFHTNMEKGIKEWKETGWTWDQSDTDTQMNGDAHSANLAYLFRKCKRFFTIKEYTGNGSNQTLSHDLECEPSMIWVKNTEDDGHDWGVYHKQLDATNPESYQLFLSTSDERIASNDMWHNTKPTGSEFTVGNNAHSNASGKKYIAYLFAADQAAFGDSTVDVISKTGTYNGDSGGPTTITLGWEPQMVMIKCITSGTPRNWIIMDKIRLMSMNRSGSSGLDGFQYMNLNGSADNTNSFIDFTPEGFVLTGSSNNNNVTGQTYIYYAIRNDMLSEPQSATEVYTSSLGTGNYPSFQNTGFAVDAAWIKNKNGSNDWNVGFRKSGEFDMKWNDKNTNEGSYSDFKWYNSDGWNWGAYGSNIQSWMFKRARGFFDLQYWDGDGTTPRQLPHQLGVTPEMMIVKSRNNISDGWYVYHKDIPSLSYLKVHSSDKEYSGADCWTSNAPTDTHFYLGVDTAVNNNTASYHGQLFASLSGISKVGSYEVNANGDSVTVDCGFSAGPRFLLIKDYTNNSTDWMLFDTVRGMAEPHASLGEMVDDVEGQKTWTVPAGITSVSVLCIGGGGGCSLYPNGTTGASGGGGGALVYKNNISVTPGQTITYHVGGGGKGATTQNNSTPDDVVSGSNAGNGGTSWFNGTSDSDAVAKALGGAGASGYSGGPGGQLNPNSVGDGGGSGGNGGSNDGNTSYWAFGGGGGGYSGDGGNGGRWQAGGSYTPGASAGQGGGAGGGAMWANQCGTGIFGEGASGAIGQGGSGGHPSNVGGSGYYPNGGKYGGGGSSHGSNGSSPALRGAQGVVRVVWSTDGTTREFPTTNVQNTDQGYDPVLKLNTQDGSVTGTNYFAKTNSGFTVNANTLLSTPNAKYIFLAIA